MSSHHDCRCRVCLAPTSRFTGGRGATRVYYCERHRPAWLARFQAGAHAALERGMARRKARLLRAQALELLAKTRKAV